MSVRFTLRFAPSLATSAFAMGVLATACSAGGDHASEATESTVSSSAPLSRAGGGFSAQTFQPLDANDVVVLGSDGNLWYEHAPFGKPPPSRSQIDGNVSAFQVAGTVANGVYVLGKDGNLWKESPNGQVPPPRTQVDGNVRSFEWAADGSGVFVLGTDGNLWLEWPNGSVPPPRFQVDTNVRAFQLIDGKHVVVLTEDTQLWMDAPPFGYMPANRSPIDANVRAFQPLATDTIAVLGTDGNLWLENPNGSVPPPRSLVDGNVASFQMINRANIFVLHPDGNLWWELPTGSGPVRKQIDGNVMAFNALDSSNLMVLGTDHNLWFEHTPFDTVPPKRELIDGNVAFPHCADRAIMGLTATPVSSRVLSVSYVNPQPVPVRLRVTNTSDTLLSQSFDVPAGAPGSVDFGVKGAAPYKVEAIPLSGTAGGEDASCTVSVSLTTPPDAPSFSEGIRLPAAPAHNAFEASATFDARATAVLQHMACHRSQFRTNDHDGVDQNRYPGERWSAEALAMMAYQGICASDTPEQRRVEVDTALGHFSSNGRTLGTGGDLDMALKDLMPILVLYRDRLSVASYRHMLAYLANVFIWPANPGPSTPTPQATPDRLAPDGNWYIRTDYDSWGIPSITESENHRLMIHSAAYLACEMLFAETNDARYDVRRNGLRDVVLNRMSNILRHDFKEYNSKVYSKMSLEAIENLEELARDADVRTASQAVLDFASAKYASSASLLRREAPYRRRKSYDENDFFADPADGNEEPAIDAMACRFALYAGTTDLLPAYMQGGPGSDIGTFLPDRCDMISRQAMGSYRVPPMIVALAQDKAHQNYFQTFAGQGNSDETSTSYNNVETYDNEGPFLIAGGGVPAESGSTAFGHQSTSDGDVGFPVPAVVLPNRTYFDVRDPRNVRNRTKTVNIDSRLCIAPGFACGHWPTVPDELKPFSQELNLSGASVSTDGDWNHRPGWKFVDYDGFYVVVYTNVIGSLTYGFFEAVPASEFHDIADLEQRVVAANAGNTPATYQTVGPLALLGINYASPRGGWIRALHTPTAAANDSNRPYPVREDRGLPLPSTNTWSWGLASGIINAGVDGRVTINSLGNGWPTCVLDLSDPQHPARRGCDDLGPRPAPVVTSISPNSGPNTGGATATIQGKWFDTTPGGTRFTFGGRAATNVNCTSMTTCTVTVPAGDQSLITQTAPVIATVAGSSGGGASYTYTAGPACTATETCIGSPTPLLTISCPTSVSFYNAPTYDQARYGTTYDEMTNPIGSAPAGVQACFGNNKTTSCTFFTGIASHRCTVTPPTPPSTCNGQQKPIRSCKAWNCCGEDGWRCGNCL